MKELFDFLGAAGMGFAAGYLTCHFLGKKIAERLTKKDTPK